MAGETRDALPDVTGRLLKESPRFSFIQALRLLRRQLLATGLLPSTDAMDLSTVIQVRPQLSLSFSETDIVGIEEIRTDDHLLYRMTVTFLGIYGSASPLPTFYTEDLMAEQSDGKCTVREFLDIVNSPLYPLFFKSWGKHRLFFNIFESPDQDARERLYCLAGIGTRSLLKESVDLFRMEMVRHIGILTQFPRSAEGLRTILSYHFGEPSFRIEQCIERTVPVPPDQRCRMGEANNALGETVVLGEFVQDRMGKFMLCVGPVGIDSFNRFLPGSPTFDEMRQFISIYLDQPLAWDMEISMEPGKVRTARLGDDYWAQLGMNTWVFSNLDQLRGEVRVRFNEPTRYLMREKEQRAS